MRCNRKKNSTVVLVLFMSLMLTSCNGKKEEVHEIVAPTEQILSETAIPTETYESQVQVTSVPTEQVADETTLFSENYKSQSQLYTDARLIIESYDAETLNNAFKYIDCEKKVKNYLFEGGQHKLSEGYLLDSYNIILSGVCPIDSRNYKFLVDFTVCYTDEDETGYLDKGYKMIMYYENTTLKDIELIENA